MAFLFTPSYQKQDADGLPLVGAALAFYRAGTTSEITVYQDSDAATPHLNPVTADSTGNFPAIFLNNQENFKIVLKDEAGVVVQTVDNIPVPAAIGDIAVATTAIAAEEARATTVEAELVQQVTAAEGRIDDVEELAEDAIAAAALGVVAPRGEVRAGQTTTLPAHAYSNGTLGVGATITATANGALATSYFDSVTLIVGSRVWVSLEGAQNGIYAVTQLGDGSTPFILTRTTDADTAAELNVCYFLVTGGTTYGGRRYQCRQKGSDIVVGTTALTFALISDDSDLSGEVITARGPEASLNGRFISVEASVGDRAGLAAYAGSVAAVRNVLGSNSSLVGDRYGFAVDFVHDIAAVVTAGGSKVDRAASILSLSRASVASYFDFDGILRYASANQWIVTCDPETGQPIGTPINAAAVNLLSNPDDLTQATWLKSNLATPTFNAGIAPDGTNTAMQIEDNSNLGFGTLTRDQPSLVPGTDWFTLGVMVKNGSVPLSQLQAFLGYLSGGTAVSSTQLYDPVNRALGTNSNVGAIASLQKLPNSWSRLVLSLPNNGTANTNVRWRLLMDPAAAANMGKLLVFKPTLYRGKRYLGSVNNRAGDVITIALSDIEWSPTQGSVVIDFAATPSHTASVTLFQIDGGNENNRIGLYINSAGELVAQFAVGGAAVSVTATGIFPLSGGRAALIWSASQVQIVWDGNVVKTEPSVPIPTGMTTLRLGSRTTGDQQPQTSFRAFVHRPYLMTAEEVREAGTVSAAAAVTDGFSTAETQAFGAEHLAKAEAVIRNGNPNLQRMTPGIGWVNYNGQSYSVAAYGHPLYTTTALTTAYMLGDDIRPIGDTSTFAVFGGSAVLKPIVSNVLSSGRNAILTPSQIEALAWTDGNLGEVAVSMTRFFDLLRFQYQGITTDTTRNMAITASGAGGRSVAELSDPGDYMYPRLLDAAAKVKAATLAISKTPYHLANVWKQGQADRLQTRSSYTSQLLTFFNSVYNDTTVNVFGQARRPATFMTQTAADWVEDSASQGLQMAQLDVATKEPQEFDVNAVGQRSIFLTAPEYGFMTSKAGIAAEHPDSNGYRLLDMFDAKCMFRVLVKGEGWKPLHMTAARRRGRDIQVAMHVPVMPLQFLNAYNDYTVENYTNKGFRLTDGAGDLPLSAPPTIVPGLPIVAMRTARDPVGTVTVIYAGKATVNGRGNLYDSDSIEAVLNYTYDAAAGDDAAVNIAALVGKPYKLFNPACVQNIVVEAV